MIWNIINLLIKMVVTMMQTQNIWFQYLKIMDINTIIIRNYSSHLRPLLLDMCVVNYSNNIYLLLRNGIVAADAAVVRIRLHWNYNYMSPFVQIKVDL